MKRRDFLRYSAIMPVAAAALHKGVAMPQQITQADKQRPDSVTLFVAGDVMTGRGIDQVLPHPGDPRIFEPWSRSALDYVQLAERTNGPIPRPVDFAYIWGDALAALDEAAPDVRIINLETAVTRKGSPWPGKGIQYRMHPDNIPCLTAAAIDGCVLANNHVLDWGYPGFEETLATLAQAGLTTVGAGSCRAAAQAPAQFAISGQSRVLVFACGLHSSGIPAAWAATASTPGLNLLPDLSENTLNEIATAVREYKRPGDVVVISLHWGGNWGYAIPEEHTRFAHALIDVAKVDLIHGHSSHHPLGIEVYQGKPILYGCGDLIDDYEGISGHEQFRSDLSLLYLVTLDRTSGDLVRLVMIPLRRRYFRLNPATREESGWLRATLDRESRILGARVTQAGTAVLQLNWP
ncbi:MAG: CapA family protein [Pseudomonadota bacterium]|nr:CapA family protein [Pseudomonadota bacterium]